MKPSERLYSILCDLAAAGKPCPTNGALAEVLGYERDESVNRPIQYLERAGLIRRYSFGHHRFFEIVETGERTADPRPPEPEATPLPDRTVGDIVAIVADVAGLPVDEILGRGRDKIVIRPRALVYHFAQAEGWSVKHIGRVVRRDHSTVLYSLHQVPIWLEHDPLFARLYRRVEEALKAHSAQPARPAPNFVQAPPARSVVPRAVAKPRGRHPLEYNLENRHEVEFLNSQRDGSDRLLRAIKRYYPERCAA